MDSTKPLTPGQRIAADTPLFFKVTHIIGDIMIIVAAILAFFHFSGTLAVALGSFGTAFAILSPFAVKDVQQDIATITSAPSLTEGLLTAIGPVLGQIQELITVFKAAQTPAMSNAVADIVNELSNPAEQAAPPAPNAGSGTLSLKLV